MGADESTTSGRPSRAVCGAAGGAEWWCADQLVVDGGVALHAAPVEGDTAVLALEHHALSVAQDPTGCFAHAVGDHAGKLVAEFAAPDLFPK